MSLPIHTMAGNYSGPPSQRSAEQYPAPPCAAEALLPVEQLPHGLWEPCGQSDSALVRTLEARGHRVIAHHPVRDGIELISEMREGAVRSGASCSPSMASLTKAGVLIHESPVKRTR